MTEPDRDRLAELRDLAERVGGSAHDDLTGATIDKVDAFAKEVRGHLEDDERLEGARKLLAFWESFVHTKLADSSDRAGTIAEETIARFEQAFDEDVIGIDLYQALETLAIVEDMPEDERENDRLGQWAARVHSLTEEFVAHLEGHRD